MPMMEPLQKNDLRKAWLIIGTWDLRSRGWLLWDIRTRKLTMRIWRLDFGRDYRICPHRRHTDSRACHADPPLSFGGGPGFRGGQTLRQGSTPMEDTLFEINQTGLSPMWYVSIPFSSMQKFDATPGETLHRHTLTRGSDVRQCKLDRHFLFNTSLEHRPYPRLLV